LETLDSRGLGREWTRRNSNFEDWSLKFCKNI
jgi:hypothetical protein